MIIFSKQYKEGTAIVVSDMKLTQYKIRLSCAKLISVEAN